MHSMTRARRSWQLTGRHCRPCWPKGSKAAGHGYILGTRTRMDAIVFQSFAAGSHFYARWRPRWNLAKSLLCLLSFFFFCIWAIIASCAPSDLDSGVLCYSRTNRQTDKLTDRQTFSFSSKSSCWPTSEAGQKRSTQNSCQRGAFSLRMKNDEQSIIGHVGGCYQNDDCTLATWQLPFK